LLGSLIAAKNLSLFYEFTIVRPPFDLLHTDAVVNTTLVSGHQLITGAKFQNGEWVNEAGHASFTGLHFKKLSRGGGGPKGLGMGENQLGNEVATLL
jgi:hypothetical protein